MLYEVLAAKPWDGAMRQRWFTDEDFDLTVWTTPEGRAHGFQLSYDKRGAPYESVLTWRAELGFDLTQLIEGGARTPILRPGGRPLSRERLFQFRSQSRQLEPSLRCLVMKQLRAYVQAQSPQAERVAASSSSR